MGDVVDLFTLRFPNARAESAREFALKITDALGESFFSHYQIKKYLDGATTVNAALQGVDDGLPSLAKAKAARVRPEPPAPPGEPDDWGHGWLKEAGLAGLSDVFIQQALSTREDVLGAPFDHESLDKIGVKKVGERCKFLRMIEKEKANTKDGFPKD